MFVDSNFIPQIFICNNGLDSIENHNNDSKVKFEKFSKNPESKDKMNIINRNLRDVMG